MTKCECGCNRDVLEGKRFFRGHNRRGTKRSPETMVKFRETILNPQFNTKWRQKMKEGWTEERKEHHRQINLGKTLPQEHRDKIGEGNEGKVRTKAMKEVYSQKNKGKRMGKDNNLWKGGISRAYKTGYNSPEYKEWRKKVFERDNYTCQHCGSDGGKYVTAHHIKSFAKYADLRFNVDNGITLCEDCHCKVDNYRAKFKKKNYITT